MESRNKAVSVVITTRNSGGTLEELLKSIKKQSYTNLEIIVVDNGSRDNTKEVARKYTNKVFDKPPERSVQRNYGAAKSRGNFLLFLDSDMVLTENIIKECIEMITSSKFGGLIIPEKSFGEKFWAKVKAWEREINEDEEYFEASRFFPKEIYNEIGGYDENLTGPEDWDFHQRVAKKYPIGRIKSYILHNEFETSLKTLIQKKYYYGLSVDKYLKKQNTTAISAKTIYFLRPAFYKNWFKLLSKPLLTLAMILMLTLETLAGGLGYLRGKFR